MKNIITAFTFVLFLIILSNKGFGQEQSKKLISITIYESLSPDISKIITIENGKKIEEIKLEKFDYKNFETTQITIHTYLDKYVNMNYKIVSELRGVLGNIMITTYRLEK